MQPLNVTLVAGLPGVGKTTWIRQQLDELPESALYLALPSGTTPIDPTYLATELPSLTVLSDDQGWALRERAETGDAIYIELEFHLDLESLVLPVDMTQCQRIAIVPPGMKQTEWHQWADVVVVGNAIAASVPELQLWRSVLTGQVLDVASLDTFWYELIQGAYGKVHRAKGLFNSAEGGFMYLDFVAGIPNTQVIELDVPIWFDGRPDRFSGIEVVGTALEQSLILQTIKDCCLDDQAIAFYQQQIKDTLQSREQDL